MVRAPLDAPFKQTQLLAETTQGVRAIYYLCDLNHLTHVRCVEMGTSSGRAYQQGVIDNLIILRDGGARLPAERHRQHCGDLVDPSGRAGSGSATMTRGHYHLIIASTATTRPMESLTAHYREDHRHAPSPRIPDKPQPYNLPRHALPLVVRHPPLLVLFPRRIHGLASLNTCGFTTVGRTSRLSQYQVCGLRRALPPRDLTLHINEEQIALPSPKATRG